MQPAAKAFTTHAWPSLARQLRQMHATGAHVDEQLNYRARLEVGHRAVAGVHRCLAASVTLRGAGAEAADPTAFITPAVCVCRVLPCVCVCAYGGIDAIGAAQVSRRRLRVQSGLAGVSPPVSQQRKDHFRAEVRFRGSRNAFPSH